ncbi:MAG TPA: hypothetical protein ENK31_10195 [Nannocystis exedens]|nr:hypothetical protein [Nannocystis exedens]
MISATVVLYVVVGAIVTISMRRPLRALVDAWHQNSNLKKALAAADEDSEDSFAHLSPALARLGQDTQVLCALLQEPLQAVQAWCRADNSPMLARVDLGDGSDLDRCDDYDLALVNARQAVWDWISAVASLSEHDKATLKELGLSDREPRELLAARGALSRQSRVPKQEQERLEAQMKPLLAALRHFEAGLQRARGTIYR